jgi:LuxR family transcriptional regulator
MTPSSVLSAEGAFDTVWVHFSNIYYSFLRNTQMKRDLKPPILSHLVQARDIAAAWRIFRTATESMGFDAVLYGASKLSPRLSVNNLGETLVLMNGPGTYAETFLTNELYVNSLAFEWASSNEGCVSWHDALRQFRVHPSDKQIELFSLNAEYGFQAGYFVSLSDVIPGTKGVVSLSHSGCVDQAEMDRLWAEVDTAMITLCTTFHLRVSSLPQQGLFKPLTSRQLEVLYWYAEGKLLQDIATIMGISLGTVEKHLRSARDALEADTTAHAVRKATTLNLLTA